MDHAPRRTFRALALLALALVPAALAGCETTGLFQGDPEKQKPENADWQATEPLAADSLETIWDRARATLELQGYEIDEPATSWERRRLVSRWVTLLAPTRFEGSRRRAHVEIDPAGADRWIVRAAVIRQRNADIDNPSNAAQAQWEPAGVEESRTAVLLWRIRAAFAE